MTSPTPIWHGFMRFLASTPICGLNPHPSWAPMYQPDQAGCGPAPTNAAEWAETYSAERDKFALERSAREDADDHQAMIADDPDHEDEEGDDPDDIFRVAIDGVGTVSVYANTSDDEPWRIYTAADIYGTFGITLPKESCA